MTVQLARLLSPVTVLGPGRRVGLWVQGCTLACTGCASVDTWDPTLGTAVTRDALVETVLRILDEDPLLTGLSLTGGEPVQQAAALAEVVERIRRQRPAIDVLMFTGYALPAARRLAPALLAGVDIAVAGPYVAERGAGGPLAGSANQVVTALTDRGRRRLEAHPMKEHGIQVSVDDGDLVIVGIPRPGDLERLEERLHQAGVDFESVSWRR